jgi:hypothetical protein
MAFVCDVCWHPIGRHDLTTDGYNPHQGRYQGRWVCHDCEGGDCRTRPYTPPRVCDICGHPQWRHVAFRAGSVRYCGACLDTNCQTPTYDRSSVAAPQTDDDHRHVWVKPKAVQGAGPGGSDRWMWECSWRGECHLHKITPPDQHPEPEHRHTWTYGIPSKCSTCQMSATDHEHTWSLSSPIGKARSWFCTRCSHHWYGTVDTCPPGVPYGVTTDPPTEITPDWASDADVARWLAETGRRHSSGLMSLTDAARSVLADIEAGRIT